MTPRLFMIIAGEPSGDLLAAELVQALQGMPGAADSKFFGAGGAEMARAGVDLAFDMTPHAVVGLWEVIKNYGKFRHLFHRLLDLALERKPDCIICVDYSGFNRRFAHAVRRHSVGGHWIPKIVQFVSPQVWASRPGRAHSMARDLDLVLSIFPFEKDWYAKRVPALPVEFVGHPMCDRFPAPPVPRMPPSNPLILLLPGSRAGELKRHLPVMHEAARLIRSTRAATFRMVLPNETLANRARTELGRDSLIEVRVKDLHTSLAEAAMAIASTGTVTMECAYFGVPTVTLYKTSWLTYQVGKRIVSVTSLTMPNLLAGETLFPEFIQGEATASNIARAALGLLDDPHRRSLTQARLKRVIESLGGPGACQRAAAAILAMFGPQTGSTIR